MQMNYCPIVEAVKSQMFAALPYAVAIVAFLIALKLLERRFGGGSRKRWRGGRRDGWRPGDNRRGPFAGRVPDAADQLRTGMRAEFRPQPLLNKSEARLFKAIDRQVLAARPDWQVM